MVRMLSAMGLVLLYAVNAQAALLASWNFDTDLNVSSKPLFVVGATGFTPIISRIAQQAGTGVGGSGAGRFTNTGSQTFTDAATITLTGPGISVSQISFDIRSPGGGSPELRITNNRTSDVFTYTGLSSSAYVPVTGTLSANFSNSITFTFARRVAEGSGQGVLIDNFVVEGTVLPEPASMAVFACLGCAGVAVRYRKRKS